MRRQLNQAILKKIYIDDTHHVRSELAEPFETLLSDEITTAARERADTVDEECREVAQDWSREASSDLVGAGVQSRAEV